MAVKKSRVNIYLPEELLRQVDELASSFMLNRSTIIQIAIKTYIDQQTMLEISKLVKMQEITKTTE